MEWNEDTIARIRALWDEGLSTAEIGRRMGITKNAVVGKAHRLNLPARPSPILRTPGEKKPRRAAARRVTGPTLPLLNAAAPSPVPFRPTVVLRPVPASRGRPAGSRPAAGRLASPASRTSASAATRPCRRSHIARSMSPSLT